eukprot:Em0006g1458a
METLAPVVETLAPVVITVGGQKDRVERLISNFHELRLKLAQQRQEQLLRFSSQDEKFVTTVNALAERVLHIKRVRIVGEIPYILEMKCITKVLGEEDFAIYYLSQLDMVINGDKGYEDVLVDREEARKKWNNLRTKLELNEELYSVMEDLKGDRPTDYSAFNLQEAREAVRLVHDDEKSQYHCYKFLKMIENMDS